MVPNLCHKRPATSEPPAAQPWTTVSSLVWYAWILDTAAALPTTAIVSHAYGRRRAGRYLAGLGAAALIRHVFLRWLAKRTTPEAVSMGDPLSLARLTCGNVIAGLVVSDVRDRLGPAGLLAWSLGLFGATALDWLDGPLARRTGATRHGAVLDIEADSWLTLWSAVAAASWGELPRWVIVPPLLRYLHPLLDLRDGMLPSGGGPLWSRVTGIGQGGLMLAALAPFRRRPRRLVLTGLAGVISGSQTTTLLLLLRQRAHR
ncbi:MAG TPA: CDP-alcohol phosphatidyltransferase family protein [Dehalococcoidia bacterium]|nr:CDP-alcohol phosphatidyltransferase family protein [Dehalococcoidia bacterium]